MPLSTSTLTTNPGWDPIWETQDPRYAQLANQYRSNDTLRRSRAQQAYEQQVYDLGQQVKSTRENTLSGLESRGVLSSGETQRRLAEIASRDAEAQARARQALVDAQSASTGQLNQNLIDLAGQREKDIADAALRKRQEEVQQWVSAVNAQQQADQMRLIQSLANRPAQVIRVPVGGGGGGAVAPAGPSQADILTLYAALNPPATAAPRPGSGGGAHRVM